MSLEHFCFYCELDQACSVVFFEENDVEAGGFGLHLKQKCPKPVAFGLKDVNELPSIEQISRHRRDVHAAVQEEIPMNEPTRVFHDTVEDLISDRFYGLEGHMCEHADRSRVEPPTRAERQSQSEEPSRMEQPVPKPEFSNT